MRAVLERLREVLLETHLRVYLGTYLSTYLLEGRTWDLLEDLLETHLQAYFGTYLTTYLRGVLATYLRSTSDTLASLLGYLLVDLFA